MVNRTARVLAVDDNATIRRAIAMRLGAKGFDVTTAEDGQGALDALARSDFDLVLLDLQMPGMRGDEVLRAVRQRYNGMELPVIMLAASDNKQDIANAIELGANDYVVKPGDLPILLARINTQLSLKEAGERLKRQAQASIEIPVAASNEDLERTTVLSLLPEPPAPAKVAATASPVAEKAARVAPADGDTLFEQLPVMAFALGQNLEIRCVSQMAAEAFGYSIRELAERSFLELCAPEERAALEQTLQGAFVQAGRPTAWETEHRARGGELFRLRERARVARRSDEVLLVLTCEDITSSDRQRQAYSFQSAHDELTGLANRKTLEARLQRVLESSHSEETEHALAILDIDQFRVINETLGHDAGDELLRQVARLLEATGRKRDTLARIGGDDFAWLLEDCPLRDATLGLETARSAVEACEFEWSGRRMPVSVSIGVVRLDRYCDSPIAAMGMADAACYAARDAGRNRVHVYQFDDEKTVSRHSQMRWVTRINDALRDDRFELCLQRIMPLGDEKMGEHYEVLIRMRDERGELVMPGQFLPAAERYHLAGRIDRWVVGHTLDWLKANPDVMDRLKLCAINLSGQSLGNDRMLAYILETLERTGVSPKKLCFEVTETAAVADVMQATRFMNILRSRGCSFSLDDFGSGFSSFGYLKHLPVDILKIDGSFVREIANSSVDLAMVKSINEMGHLLGKRTVAEFVESDVEIALLRGVKVDYAQGYAFGRPTPMHDLGR